VTTKPTVEELGIDPDAQEWQRSGDGAGAIEITFTRLAPGASPASAAHQPGDEPGQGSVDVPGQESVDVPGQGSGDEPGQESLDGPGQGQGQEPGQGQDQEPRQGQDQEPGHGEDWVLMRVAGDPDRRVLVFDRKEWECFLDGVRKGEFDDAADNDTP
jgi:hypothetical protein